MKLVLGERAEQMARAGVDDPVDLRGETGSPAGAARPALRMGSRNWSSSVGDRRADGEPVRRCLVARRDDRVAQRVERARSRSCGRPARDSSGPQQRIGDGGLVEFAQMRVASARPRSSGSQRS